jgi:hypothetical protein
MDRNRIKNMITWAIQGYAQSESACEAMQKLNQDAESIAGHAMKGIFSDDNTPHGYTVEAK